MDPSSSSSSEDVFRANVQGSKPCLADEGRFPEATEMISHFKSSHEEVAYAVRDGGEARRGARQRPIDIGDEGIFGGELLVVVVLLLRRKKRDGERGR